MKFNRTPGNGTCLEMGTHCGYRYAIHHNAIAYRCGYVLIPPGHPWCYKGYDDIDADIHGGLTYAQNEADGYVIGFDCAHSGDAPDPKLPGYKDYMTEFHDHGTIRSQDYVRSECISLCEQALKAGGPPSYRAS